MRKIHLLGILLILADYALLLVCAFFDIGMGPEEATTLESNDPNFGFTIRIVGVQYIEWYVWLPLILIGFAGLVCIFWPPLIRSVSKARRGIHL